MPLSEKLPRKTRNQNARNREDLTGKEIEKLMMAARVGHGHLGGISPEAFERA